MSHQPIRTLRVPLQIDGRGGLAFVSSTQDIVRQQITDLLVTNRYERVMRPEYGANIREFLFAPKAAELMKLRASEVHSLLSATVRLATIVSVTMTPMADRSAAVRVDVAYSIAPSPEVFQLSQTVSGLVTEETML